MLKVFLEKMRDKMNKKVDGNNKKNIENLVVFLILLIITVIAINTIWGGEETNQKEVNNMGYKQLAMEAENGNNMENREYDLEQELEDILSKIEGVGAVNVLITYSETSEVIAMYNESYVSSVTKEEDTSGGIRTINQTDTEKEIIFEERDRSKSTNNSKDDNAKD